MARTVGSAADQTRQRILEVATRLILEQGYHGMSVQGIADELSMTKGALYYHFRSKEELLQALTNPIIDEMTGYVTDARAAGRVTAPLLDRLVDQVVRHQPLLRAIMGDPSVHGCDALRDRLPALVTELTQILGGGTDHAAQLRGRCAFGVIQAGVTGSRTPQTTPGLHTHLTAADRSFITAAALAVLQTPAAHSEPQP